MRIALKTIKWFAISLGALVGLIVVAMVVVYFIGGSKLNQTYDVDVTPISIPTDSASLERGEHLVRTVGLCTECHGERLQGKVIDDDPLFGTLVGKNLTAGRGGIGSDHSDTDLVRAIRHGVDHDGTALVVMPSEFFNRLSEEDLGSIVAYVRSVPPVDNELPDTSLSGPLGRLFLLVEDSLLPAAIIDHDAPYQTRPAPGITVAYGEYLAVSCPACHGDDLGGAAAPNITPAGRVGHWSEAQFVSTLRQGVTPRGSKLDPEEMPWKSFGQLSDDELSAIWLYLKSVPLVGER